MRHKEKDRSGYLSIVLALRPIWLGVTGKKLRSCLKIDYPLFLVWLWIHRNSDCPIILLGFSIIESFSSARVESSIHPTSHFFQLFLHLLETGVPLFLAASAVFRNFFAAIHFFRIDREADTFTDFYFYSGVHRTTLFFSRAEREHDLSKMFDRPPSSVTYPLHSPLGELSGFHWKSVFPAGISIDSRITTWSLQSITVTRREVFSALWATNRRLVFGWSSNSPWNRQLNDIDPGLKYKFERRDGPVLKCGRNVHPLPIGKRKVLTNY